LTNSFLDIGPPFLSLGIVAYKGVAKPIFYPLKCASHFCFTCFKLVSNFLLRVGGFGKPSFHLLSSLTIQFQMSTFIQNDKTTHLTLNKICEVCNLNIATSNNSKDCLCHLGQNAHLPCHDYLSPYINIP
jgi:hypothetical protein